jgi:hypothetical protein
MNKKYPPVVLFVIPALLLAACGAGASTSTAIPVPPTRTRVPPTPTPIPATPTNTSIPFASAGDIPSRRISLREFTGNNIILEIPLEFDVPEAYEIVNLFDPQYLGNVSPYALSIWLPGEDIEGYRSGLPLSADSGLFYIKISDSVVYDAATDTFSGWPLSDLEVIAREAQGTYVTFQEKRQVGEFPILIMEESTLPDAQGRTLHKYLYIATLAAETIGIIFLPSATNIERDEFIWKNLVETLSIKN